MTDSLRRSEDGSVGILFAVASIPLVAAIGVALSVNLGDKTRSRLQDALDGAVLAGTLLMPPATEAERLAEAERFFAAHWPGEDVDPEFDVDGVDVQGWASMESQTPFLSIFGRETMEVGAMARAIHFGTDPICLLALNPRDAESIYVYGNAALEADCAIQANSTSSTGIDITGAKSSMVGSRIGVAGRAGDGNYTPAPISGTRQVDDPYADLLFPPAGPCADKNGRHNKDHIVLSPGTYCGGLTIKAGSKITLQPGIYVILDGQMDIGSKSVVTGEEVLIAFKGKDSYLMMQGGSAMHLTSPDDGKYMNMQFMSDRDLSGSKFNQEWTTILGGSVLTFDGVMYLPEQNVWASGKDHDIVISGKSPTLIMVADTIWAQGNTVMRFSNVNSRGLENLDWGPNFEFGSARLDR